VMPERVGVPPCDPESEGGRSAEALRGVRNLGPEFVPVSARLPHLEKLKRGRNRASVLSGLS
jgi:hypothetical protein